MLGALLLAVMTVFGWGIKELLRIDTPYLYKTVSSKGVSIPKWCFDIPFYAIVGTTIYTTINFFLSWGFSLIENLPLYPLFYSNIVSILLSGVLIYFAIVRRKNINIAKNKKENYIYILSIIFIGVFTSYLFFHSFYVSDNILHSGFTIFSDFAPHTAVVSSFSVGNNFPVEYPHFAGDNINYHFFFFYLVANLNYLGLRFDFAMNIPSIIAVLSFASLLGTLAVLLTGKKLNFFIAPIMLFIRSSLAIFTHLLKIIPETGYNPIAIAKHLSETEIFIGNTVHDDWGLWALNVYANQRHLLWGFSAILIILIIFIPTIKESLKVKSVGQYLLNKELWVISQFRYTIFACLFIFILPYWHGSMVVTLLTVLFVMVFFARQRLSYIAVASSAILGTFLFSQIFSKGSENIASPRFLWGFISPDKSILGVLLYLFEVVGIWIILTLLALFIVKKYTSKVLIISFFAPLILAFTVSLTPDVTVNHKYIIASVALMNIFVGFVWIKFAEYTKKVVVDKDKNGIKKYALKCGIISIFIVVSFALFSTGIVEFMAFKNKNENSFKINLEGELKNWVVENTDTDDVFLTAPYHMNEFLFSGRKVFFGWSYYTFTAGHDTVARDIIYRELLAGNYNDIDTFLNEVKKHNIKYIIIDADLLSFEEYYVNEEFFIDNFEKVFETSDSQRKIYQLFG